LCDFCNVIAYGRSPNRRRMLLGFSDGTLILLSTLVDSITIIKRIVITKKHEPRLIVWHSLGAIICVFFASGHMV
jgi:alpha-beta hydrolase superfamily lysophospholipase